MCVIQLQIYIMTCYKYILIIAVSYQMLKEVQWISHYDSTNLTLDKYCYSEQYIELNDLPPLEGDKEKYYSVPSTPISKGAKERKGLKVLTPNIST